MMYLRSQKGTLAELWKPKKEKLLIDQIHVIMYSDIINFILIGT